jgi:hypothetical protein
LVVPVAVAVITSLFLTNPPPTGDPQRSAPVDPEAAALSADLEARRAAVHRRIATKDELLSALVAGRLTLVQVAAEFLRLNAEDEAVAWVIRQRYPGATDEEKTARNVLDFLSVSVRDLPNGERVRLMARLEREFAEAFGTASAAKALPVPADSRHRP